MGDNSIVMSFKYSPAANDKYEKTRSQVNGPHYSWKGSNATVPSLMLALTETKYNIQKVLVGYFNVSNA